MGNCASLCPPNEVDENPGRRPPSYTVMTQPTKTQGHFQITKDQRSQETEEERRRKVLEATEKRLASEGQKREVKSDALRFQQQRQAKIEEAEERSLHAGGMRQSSLKWQAD